MTIRPKYRTKQREILIEYFRRKRGTHLTAGDVCRYFKEQGISIGQSTVYRHLESLVDDGIIKKYVIDCNSPACFEYSGEEYDEKKDCCFHCKCEKCGKLIHMHCEELEEISHHLLKEHKFKLNPMRTVYYGICEECVEKEEDI